jgi:metallo-beta-lactamase class B
MEKTMSHRTFFYGMPSLMLAATLPYFLSAQAPEAAPAKPDSPQVKADIQKAKKSAGPMWAQEAHFFCEAPHGNRPDDPLLEPTKIFDNVYVIGRTGTAVYAITTSAGIMLIDTGYPNEVEQVLVAGMKKAGLDPAQVKIVLVGHGHVDHFGGAPYLQEHYGAHIYVSQADWNLMENPPPARGGKAPKGPPPTLPNHDRVMTEGQPITLGDVKVTPFAIPGHTPGAMGLIFPVKDNGKTHMAAMYAGTILGAAAISDEGLQQYVKSIAHFKEETKKAKVDVELQNHPLFDDFTEKLEKLRSRKAGEPNPFVVGEANYQKFLDVMSACMQANIDRRKP